MQYIWGEKIYTAKQLKYYNGPEWEMQKTDIHGKVWEMLPRDHSSWKGSSGDEYKCMKMKCLSQYRDSAGTQVTEECSATPTLGGWTGY